MQNSSSEFKTLKVTLDFATNLYNREVPENLLISFNDFKLKNGSDELI